MLVHDSPLKLPLCSAIYLKLTTAMCALFDGIIEEFAAPLGGDRARLGET